MRWERLGRKVALDVALGINYLHTRYVTTGCLRPIVPVVLMFYYAHGALLSCMGSASAASLVPVISCSIQHYLILLYSCHMSQHEQGQTSMAFGVQAASHDA